MEKKFYTFKEIKDLVKFLYYEIPTETEYAKNYANNKKDCIRKLLRKQDEKTRGAFILYYVYNIGDGERKLYIK